MDTCTFSTFLRSLFDVLEGTFDKRGFSQNLVGVFLKTHEDLVPVPGTSTIYIYIYIYIYVYMYIQIKSHCKRERASARAREKERRTKRLKKRLKTTDFIRYSYGYQSRQVN